MITSKIKALTRIIKAATCPFLLCLSAQHSLATEGVDYTTGGNWNTTSVSKPWSFDGQNRYGTAGYHFYNVTAVGGKNRAHRPIDENLWSTLPAYIKSITPTEGTYTSHSYGYLNIDAPWVSESDKVESGLLVKPTDPNDDRPVELLTMKLARIRGIYGFRLGILIANADRHEIAPEEVILSAQDKSWSRRIINLPPSVDGIWAFFNVPAKYSNQELTLSIRSRSGQPGALGGLVFDDLILAPEARPLNVSSDEAVAPDGNVVWDANLGNDAPLPEPINWEHWLAKKISDSYKKNESRINAIQQELEKLPAPYAGEPTGTGGYLCHWSGSSKNKNIINFSWDEPMSVDAVALFPLRLFLADEHGLTEDAYWPGEIQIHAIDDEKEVLLYSLNKDNTHTHQSLPQLVTFPSYETSLIRITYSELARKSVGSQFAGGFSEICIFSGDDNVAPRANVQASSSREGYRVFSKLYLTDGHTPLGLPELGPRLSGSLGISIRTPKHTLLKPIDIRLNFEEDILVDSVRLDPAVIYKPGQAFPVRFSVDLLNAKNKVIDSDIINQDSPMRNPGLNPHISYFPETTVRTIRVRIYEISKPTSLSRPWVQISEITPMIRGEHIQQPASILAPVDTRKSGGIQIFDPTGRRLYWRNDFVYDGQTQSGRVLQIRKWAQGLHQRKSLILEAQALEAEQVEILNVVRLRTIWTIGIFLALVVIVSVYLIIQSKVSSHRELRKIRESIASDLHDEVGSNLGTITLHTELLMDQLDEPSVRENLQGIRKLAKESVYGLREVLHTTAPRIGRAQDILKYMEELSQLVLPDIELKMDLDPSANTALRSPERRKGILLYFKEAITNIRSHADCHQVSISLHKYKGYLELIIEDDGVGMPAMELSQESTLRTLKLRAEQLKANLDIISKVDGGTQLKLKIPTRT